MSKVKIVNLCLNTVLCGRVSVPVSRYQNCRACLGFENDDEGNIYVFCEDDE